jgi:hypothetical protein
MVIALDFDRTLFDTDADIREMHERGVADLLGDPRVNDIVNPLSFLYADTLSFLAAHADHLLYVVSAVTFSYGPHAGAYQRDKIERAGVASRVREVILTGESKVDALRVLVERHPAETIVFIDDRIDVLADVHEHIPHVRCVHMMRPNAKRMGEGALPIALPTVTSLDALAGILTGI